MVLVVIDETACQLAVLIVHGLVGTEERNVTVRVHIHCTDEVIGIETVLLAREHALCLWLKCNIGKDVCCNAGSHALATLGVDYDYTVCSTCTINGGTVLENLDTAYVVYIDSRQHVVVCTHVDGLVTLLQVPDYTVHHNKWLCIGIERVDTADEHCSTNAHST